MKTFTHYVKLRESGDIDDPNGNEETLKKIIRLAWDRYEPETKDFFNQLANKDPDIKQELEDLDKNPEITKADRLGNSERKGDEQDVVMPAAADTNPGLEGEGGM